MHIIHQIFVKIKYNKEKLFRREIQMGRTEQRKAAKREKIAVTDLCKVQRKYVPELFELLSQLQIRAIRTISHIQIG